MTPDQLQALIDATWPAGQTRHLGPWCLRQTEGGGSRVNAATADAPDAVGEIDLAETEMRKAGQIPLFAVRAGEDALDTALDARGYRIKDPVTLYAAPVARVATRRPPPVTCFEVWPPLEAQKEIWADGGIGAARIAIMARAKGPKTTILGRLDDTPAGTLYVACHGETAMIHAVEIAARFRRKGLARHMMIAAAFWAADAGATELTLLVTKANVGANALYASLGMAPAAGYHYRIHPEAT